MKLDLMELLPEKWEHKDTRGDLKQFLSLFENEFNQVFEKYDDIKKIKWVDWNDNFYSQIEDFFGLTPLECFSKDVRRELIKKLVSLYRKKGTEESIRELLTTVLEVDDSQIEIDVEHLNSSDLYVTHAGRIKEYNEDTQEISIYGELEDNDIVIFHNTEDNTKDVFVDGISQAGNYSSGLVEGNQYFNNVDNDYTPEIYGNDDRRYIEIYMGTDNHFKVKQILLSNVDKVTELEGFTLNGPLGFNCAALVAVMGENEQLFLIGETPEGDIPHSNYKSDYIDNTDSVIQRNIEDIESIYGNTLHFKNIHIEYPYVGWQDGMFNWNIQNKFGYNKYWIVLQFHKPIAPILEDDNWSIGKPKLRLLQWDNLGYKATENSGSGGFVDDLQKNKVLVIKDSYGNLSPIARIIKSNTPYTMILNGRLTTDYNNLIQSGQPVEYEIVNSPKRILHITVNDAGFPKSELDKKYDWLKLTLEDKFIPSNLTLDLDLRIG